MTLTTTQVGRLLDVSNQTVINWHKKGKLTCTRLLKGPRKISLENFATFMHTNNISISALDTNTYIGIKNDLDKILTTLGYTVNEEV